MRLPKRTQVEKRGPRPIPKEALKVILRAHPDSPIVSDLVREIRRLRRYFIGEELHCVSPIAERTGRRVKILVNRLKADEGCIAVREGVAELAREADQWKNVSVDELNLPLFMRAKLAEKGVLTINELICKTDKDLLYGCDMDDVDFIRIQKALKRLGVGVYDEEDEDEEGDD